ncbi:hypothetical protein PIB30_057501 [Stylosanthes scabra]|uniref:Uncharacterized protein n=1 Tax=Stylosanthes scabra TaxID=79078 RepID=A0ABU6YH37_9FABA|nr:hypothetical protein [Stylosanthes scabra]
MVDNRLLSRCIEKAKTDMSISRKRARNSSTVQVAPGLELPSWMQLSFRPTALMGLNQDEVAVAVYLYGNLSHKLIVRMKK